MILVPIEKCVKDFPPTWGRAYFDEYYTTRQNIEVVKISKFPNEASLAQCAEKLYEEML